MAKQKAKAPAKKKSAAKKSAPAKSKAPKSKTVKKASSKAPAAKKTAKKTVAKKTKAAPKKTPAKTAKKPVAEKPAKGKPVDQAAFKLARSIVNAIEEKKGENIVCLDLRKIENRVCDYFIICEGNSTTQIEAIAGSVEFLVKKELGERPYRSEGYENATWILIDYITVIVHVFDRETRYFYNLESLWADGEKIKF